MKNSNEFKLIDGEFTADEAMQVLTALINYKIDYHNREDFSNHIRFNQDMEHSKKRIHELNTTKDSIPTILAEAKEKNLILKINGLITITTEEK